MLITVKIEVHTAWWWTWLYLPAINCLIDSGMEPDMEKVSRVAEKAVRLKCVEVPPNEPVNARAAGTSQEERK